MESPGIYGASQPALGIRRRDPSLPGMDTARAVEHIAHAEARRVRAFRDESELDDLDERLGRKLPAFRVTKNYAGSSAFVAEALDRDPSHPNGDRLPLVVDFLNRRVLPLVDPDADPAGCYRLELHDSYTYLPGRERYEDAFSFGRAHDAKERRVALLPDPYHMVGFGGAVDAAAQDPVPWNQKAPKLFFAGATTGDRCPALNARLRACMWSLDRRDVSVMLITKLAQMRLEDVVEAHPRFLEATNAPVPIDEHFAFRYQVNIAGNTAAWSRLPMMLASRCLVVHARQRAADDATWYYPLLREGAHYVGADSADGEDLLRAHAFCRAYDGKCRAMVDAANAVARDLFHPGAAAAYAAALLEECVWLSKP